MKEITIKNEGKEKNVDEGEEEKNMNEGDEEKNIDKCLWKKNISVDERNQCGEKIWVWMKYECQMIYECEWRDEIYVVSERRKL